MNLNLYNILSHIIPGFLLFMVGGYTLGIDFNAIPPLSATAIAYIIGFFTSTVGAWAEGGLFWTWGGKPSNNLLKGKGCGRIAFTEWKKVKNLLAKELGKQNATENNLFGVAMRISNKLERAEDMNAQYAFTRSLMVAVVGSAAFTLYANPCDISLWVVAIIATLVVWYRTKERGYYYAREVLAGALNKLSGN